MIRNFSQKATIGTSFDVCWSLVAQAVPENEPFLSKLSIFRNRYPRSTVFNVLEGQTESFVANVVQFLRNSPLSGKLYALHDFSPL